MISAIIPAYNEEKTIRKVIETVDASPLVDEIIAVDDGSTDGTLSEIKKTNAKWINLGTNIGKGGALSKGIQKSRGDILLFLDADLMGLNIEHIRDLLLPITNNSAEMTIGLFTKDLTHRQMPHFSGQRALRRTVLEGIPNFEKAGFGFEMILTRHTRARKVKTKKICLKNITHVLKQKKQRKFSAWQNKFKATWQIIRKTSDPFSLVAKFLLVICMKEIL